MDNKKLEPMRHSAEHVLTMAMLRLWRNRVKAAMGPATEEGFYFDFDSDIKISESDFPKIEAEMVKIIKENLPITRGSMTPNEAKEFFNKNIYKNNQYKHEWIDLIKKRNEDVSIYWMGEKNKDIPDTFVDICSGPHVNSTGKIGPFKLLSIAGAYWHGDEKNKMLTRIYGTCFSTKEELDKYLWRQEEAKKRDHRKLGKELDLFVISENIGKGLPLLTPKGTIIREEIMKLEYKLEKEYNFQHVVTPHIARSEIYKKTGHWQHYRDVMYAPFGIDGEEYVLKPMNCPHHYMIYASRPRSYKDLPMRLAEPGTCYRFEKTGELSGLLRVRALSIDDSHILMRENQIEDEFKRCIEMVRKMFAAFQLKDFYVRLSLADPSDAIKFIADEKTWKKAGDKLEKIVKDNHLKYVIAKGEASFYGPKIDFMIKDSLSREWQMSTLQLDLFMGKKLNLTYINEAGKEEHPVILHRGLTGSLERTMAILIEHFSGAFPVWLSPVQVIVLPISDKFQEYVQKVEKVLKFEGIRTEVNLDNETLGKKIRQATLQKIPYLIIIGEKELQKNVGAQFIAPKTITVRTREGKDLGMLDINKFIIQLKTKIENFS